MIRAPLLAAVAAVPVALALPSAEAAQPLALKLKTRDHTQALKGKGIRVRVSAHTTTRVRLTAAVGGRRRPCRCAPSRAPMKSGRPITKGSSGRGTATTVIR